MTKYNFKLSNQVGFVLRSTQSTAVSKSSKTGTDCAEVTDEGLNYLTLMTKRADHKQY